MDYKKVYYQIIENRKLNSWNGYTESHHILPKSLGGSNLKENLVNLNAREHFLCHYLLTKFYPPKTKEYYSTIQAFASMCWRESENQKRYVNNRLYQFLREQHSEAMSFSQLGAKNSQYNKIWIYSLELKKCKLIMNGDPIPDGWKRGRKLNFSSFSQREKRKEERKKEKFLLKKEEEKIKQNYWTATYNLYCEIGFDCFVKQTGYNKTKQNFVMNCAKYAIGFIPQNGKRRGPRKTIQ